MSRRVVALVGIILLRTNVATGAGVTDDKGHQPDTFDGQYELAIVEPAQPTEIAFFEKWAQDAGIQDEKVRMANFSHEIFDDYKLRGMEATTNLRKGDMLVSVPRSMILSSEYARGESTLAPLFNSNEEAFSNEEVVLAVQVLFEMQTSTSPWVALFSVFPHRFTTSCEFDVEELRQLEGSPLLAETKERQLMFENEFENIKSLLLAEVRFDSATLTFTAYKYARLVVQTRAFAMLFGGPAKVLGIVPVADMFNHNAAARVKWQYDAHKRRYLMFTDQAYSTGTQVFSTYGQRSNRRLLLDFGFVVLDNSNDFVNYPQPLIDSSDQVRNKLLTDLKVPYRSHYPIRLGEMPHELMIAVRVAHATEEELLSLQRMVQMKPYLNSPTNLTISVKNEILALDWMKKTAEDFLAVYRDTYEEDTTLLSGKGDLTRNTYNAIIIRQSEKRIYKSVLEFVNDLQPILILLDKYGHQGPATTAWLAMSTADYLTDVLGPLAGLVTATKLDSTSEPPDTPPVAPPTAPPGTPDTH